MSVYKPKGVKAEARVNGILRGGYLFNGIFEYCGSVSVGHVYTTDYTELKLLDEKHLNKTRLKEGSK